MRGTILHPSRRPKTESSSCGCALPELTRNLGPRAGPLRLVEAFDYGLDGTIDGGKVHDMRDATFTGGYANGNSGNFAVPDANSPKAPGVELCVTGVVGFVKGGPEDSLFEFSLRSAHLGPNCTGAEVPIDVRGCLN